MRVAELFRCRVLAAVVLVVSLMTPAGGLRAQPPAGGGPGVALGDLVDGPAAVPAPQIVERLMPLWASGVRNSTATISRVMLHFTSAVLVNPENPLEADAIIDLFTSLTLNGNPVSAHYLIGRDGTVYRLVDESRAAYHAGRGQMPGPPYLTNVFNHHSIGIEMAALGSLRDMRPFMGPARYAEIQRDHPDWIGFTDAQYESLRRLLADLIRRHPEIEPSRTHIIGHSEYASPRKTDPGELFDYSRIGLPALPPANWARPPEDSPTTGTR